MLTASVQSISLPLSSLSLSQTTTTTRLQTFRALVEGADRKFDCERDVSAYDSGTSQY